MMNRPIRKKEWAHELGARNGESNSTAGTHAKKEGQDAGPWEGTVQEIISYLHLGDDWDGFGAKAPGRELLESAIGLAHVFHENGIEPPHRVVPGINGTVLFEWQDANGTYTEVEIDQPLHADVMVVEPGQPARHWSIPSE
jgi:hypothetical protein